MTARRVERRAGAWPPVPTISIVVPVLDEAALKKKLAMDSHLT